MQEAGVSRLQQDSGWLADYMHATQPKNATHPRYKGF